MMRLQIDLKLSVTKIAFFFFFNCSHHMIIKKHIFFFIGLLAIREIFKDTNSVAHMGFLWMLTQL